VARIFQIVLTKDLSVDPFQTRPISVSVDGDPSAVMGDVVRGIVSPSEECMAELQCD